MDAPPSLMYEDCAWGENHTARSMAVDHCKRLGVPPEITPTGTGICHRDNGLIERTALVIYAEEEVSG